MQIHSYCLESMSFGWRISIDYQCLQTEIPNHHLEEIVKTYGCQPILCYI